MMQRAAQPPWLEPGEALLEYYSEMLQRLGPQKWWPARTRLEVILGAILTQNASWHNAALAVGHLRKQRLLALPRLRKASRQNLESAVRPAGFFRQKTRTIRNFLEWLERSYGGSLTKMFRRPPDELRHGLLEISGIGPETADAILLYAGRKPFFVADAYTRRILARHEWISTAANYDQTRRFLHNHLPADAELFGEYHALLVEIGKRYCERQAPHCECCPLAKFLVRRAVRNEASRTTRANGPEKGRPLHASRPRPSNQSEFMRQAV